MQNPCGKCSTCPCSSSKKDKRQADRQADQPQPQQSSPSKSPKLECLCVSRRRQTPAPLEAPMVDTYTCTRARPEPVRQVPLDERCTCRIKPTPAQCECAPPVQPQASYRQVDDDVMPPTRAQITCGQPVPNQHYNQRPQYTQSGSGRCGHCQGQQKKKKCVIQ